MPHYRGRDLAVTFDSEVISGDGRSINYEETADVLDDTVVGLDNRTKLASLKDGSGTFEALDVTGAWSAAWQAVAPGATGTMLVHPEGTSTGKREASFTAIITSRSFSEPYDDLATISVGFDISGAVTESVQA